MAPAETPYAMMAASEESRGQGGQNVETMAVGSVAQGPLHQNDGENSTSSSRIGDTCCSAKPSPQLRVVPKALCREELLNTPKEEIFKSLNSLVRLGDFNALEAMLKQLLEVQPSAKEEILHRLEDTGYTLLHWAAKRVDDTRILALLLKHMDREYVNCASTDKVGMAPLHWACTESGSIPVVAILLEAGANLELGDQSGCTPLLIAAQYGQADLVAYLLWKGANENAVDKSRDSALHWAAYKGSVQVCGLLLYRQELDWTDPDKYGQTPLHLSALRGHTAVVRYLLENSSLQSCKANLESKDVKDQTPFELALLKKQMNVARILRAKMNEIEGSSTCMGLREMGDIFSYQSWRIWFGWSTGKNDVMDEAPTAPFYWTGFHIGLGIASYVVWITPVFGNEGSGIMWDHYPLHLFNLFVQVMLLVCFFKIKTTSPGVLDDRHPETAKYRALYDETLDRLGAEPKPKFQLCHSCHLARPLRSKHCRVTKQCVLMFDHHCPFVGNTIGLNNYRWFYWFLFFLTLAVIGWSTAMGIYLHRRHSWQLLLLTIYLAFHIIPVGGMFIYHTQLSVVNLTTNEHHNLHKYDYLIHPEKGTYRNPFFRGLLTNFVERVCVAPSEKQYDLQNDEQIQTSPLLSDPVASMMKNREEIV